MCFIFPPYLLIQARDTTASIPTKFCSTTLTTYSRGEQRTAGGEVGYVRWRYCCCCRSRGMREGAVGGRQGARRPRTSCGWRGGGVPVARLWPVWDVFDGELAAVWRALLYINDQWRTYNHVGSSRRRHSVEPCQLPGTDNHHSISLSINQHFHEGWQTATRRAKIMTKMTSN